MAPGPSQDERRRLSLRVFEEFGHRDGFVSVSVDMNSSPPSLRVGMIRRDTDLEDEIRRFVDPIPVRFLLRSVPTDEEGEGLSESRLPELEEGS